MEIRNPKLRARIVEKYGHQWKFAEAVGVDNAVVSKVIVRGKTLPPETKEKWARELQTKVEDVFTWNGST